MSDISRKALIEWLNTEIFLSKGSSPVLKADKWAFQQIKKEVESGRFNLTESEGEAIILREALNRIMDEVEKHTSEMFSDHIRLIGHKALIKSLSSHREDKGE